MIKLDSNENQLIHDIDIKSIVTNVDPRNYPDVTISALREKLSKKLNVSMEEVFCSTGSDALIKVITFCLVRSNEEILIPEVAFPTYEIAAKMKECLFKLIPLKHYGIDLDLTLKSITNKTRLIWISNPHNPTGTLLSQEEIEAFLDKVPEDIYVVLDEAYREYVNEGFPDGLELYKKYKNLVFIRTFSKAYGLAGVRVGYGFARKEIVDKLKLGLGPFDVNSYAQELAYYAIDADSYVSEVCAKNKIELQYYEEVCKELDIEYIPSFASFIMIKVDNREAKLCKYLLDNSIIVKPGSKIGMPGWVRISVGESSQNESVINSLRTFFKKY